jgi:hypothetical protein
VPIPIPRVIAREKKTVQAMVRIYCADHHGGGALCESCRGLLDYSHQRLDHCPYGEEKPTCKECPVHCYKPDRRAEMRDVMRYAGPRMLWRHPWLAVVHLWQERVRKSPGRPPRRDDDQRA